MIYIVTLSFLAWFLSFVDMVICLSKKEELTVEPLTVILTFAMFVFLLFNL